ncbi:MAG: type II toxin-antitoxin system HicB family antitoxin [Chloroflexota bacterium]|nr:type II toxin-antitoxin system HicB family antitoxin [Chloroflexota bacterium]
MMSEAKPGKNSGVASFTARVRREGAWFVAQATEIDIASQGQSESEALANLREALELYFMPGPSEEHVSL